MMTSYLNSETLDMFDDITQDGSEQRKKYFLKMLDEKYYQLLTSKIPLATFSKTKLNDINPLLPKSLFPDDREALFMRIKEQKYGSIGFTVLGRFLEGNDSPDSLEIYLSKMDKSEDGTPTVTLWKNLKSTPGFEKIYKFGNSKRVQKQQVVFGGNKDTSGTIVLDTNVYELLTATRDFLSKAENKVTKEHKLLQGMLRNDYSFMDIHSIYKKIDSWSTKNNELVSGKLENLLYNMSQIHDSNFTSPRTNIGEHYMMERKLDNDVFETASAIFKRNSTSNRIEFLKKAGEKMYDFYNTKDQEELKKDGIKKIKSELHYQNIKGFKSNLNTFEDVVRVLTDNEETQYKAPNVIKGGKLIQLLKKKEDYLGKSDVLINRLKKGLSEKDKVTDIKFSSETILEHIKKIDEEFKTSQEYLIQEMSSNIKSKLNVVFDQKYNDYVYRTSLNKNKIKNTLDMILHDTTREFYDKYNEKTDLYEIMMRNRNHSKINEIQTVADRVEFIRDNNGKILDAVIHRKNFVGINSFKNDAELKWGYYKARSAKGASSFDELSIEKRLELASKYKSLSKNHKDLFKKESEMVSLGRYDNLNNFIEAQNTAKKQKYEMTADSILSRTNDKVTSKIHHSNDKNLPEVLTIKGGILVDDSLVKLKINFNKGDGFNKNDFIKEMASHRSADFKKIDFETQKIIEKNRRTYLKNYRLQQSIKKVQSTLKKNVTNDELEHRELNQMLSFLKGGRERKYNEASWVLDANGELRYLKFMGENPVFSKRLKSYSAIYDEIVKKMNSNYSGIIGYALPSTYRSSGEKMKSTTELMGEILTNKNISKNLNNSTFMAILNHDQIVNESGASKQQSLIRGNTYLTSLGYAQPGLMWNKITQRTYQAQDLLGEQVIGNKTVSEINAEIIKRIGLSGVNTRPSKYTTEELFKTATNNLNIKNDIRNTFYERGRTYKTFAIGDVNTKIGDGLNSFTGSFQEGMTAAKSMILTTNAIRNKSLTLNLEEIDHEMLGLTKVELHKKLQTKDGLENILSQILNKELYDTIDGRKKYNDIMSELSSEDFLKSIDGSYNSVVSLYKRLATLTGEKPKEFRLSKENAKNLEFIEKSKMRVAKEIYGLLDDMKYKTKMVALPNTSQGKNVLTTELVKTHNEFKPELGFSISDFSYNKQTHNIEIMLENLGVSTQGSKGQTNGAKFTISEIYDFLKVSSKNKEIFVDALFNNKTEKRQQTGMLIHSALQTVFTNVYESAGETGVNTLRSELKELLKDMEVEVKNTKHGFEIDETYLTTLKTKDKRSYKITADDLEKFMTDPTANSWKYSTEKAKEILARLEKKYSSEYMVDGELKAGTEHFGIINALQKGYASAYKKLGLDETPFVVSKAKLKGYADNKETIFGEGSLLILKLASERVNSNASKKKESALKISREMLEMLRISGYNELSNYVDNKNTRRLSNVLGDVYNNMKNTDILRYIHSNNKDFDISKINMAMSDSLKNGVLFNLDSLSKDDLLLNDQIGFLKNADFIEKSILGRSIKAKNLDSVVDGKLENAVNVVVNDTGMSNFVKEIQSSVHSAKEHFLTKSAVKNEFSEINHKAFLMLDKLGNLDKSNDISYTEFNTIRNFLKKNSNSIAKSIGTEKTYNTLSFLDIVDKSFRDDYAMSQLSTIMKTGNMITTFNLDYSVDEVDGTIVNSVALNKIKSIARKNYEFNNISSSTKNFFKKIKNVDQTVVDDIYQGMLDYYSGKKDASEVKIYNDLFSKLNFFKTPDAERMQELQKSTFQVKNLDYMVQAEIQGAKDFIENKSHELNVDKHELSKRIQETQASIEESIKNVNSKKHDIYERIVNSETSIKGKLFNTIFGKDKLSYKKHFNSFLNEQIAENYSSGFELLKDYITPPDGSENLFKKKGGKITSAQKFKVNSSIVTNPLEGSNLLEKMSNMLFDAKNSAEFKKNYTELQEFLGSSIVNEKLFKDENNNDLLATLLSSDSDKEFQKISSDIKGIFNKNFADISEVMILDKRYLNSFRKKEDWKNITDIYSGQLITDTGFVREMAFASRHPQQTTNHLGAVLGITIDSDSRMLKNKYARATLTYMPKEKNNAGMIMLGKKTMLYRRADHDGDKTQASYLDFIENTGLKERTRNHMFLDYQIKNDNLGEWDEISGRYKKITGMYLDSEGKAVKFSSDKETALEQIENIFGMTEEELNAHTKMRQTYNHVIRERAKKEFNKHYNAIYELMADIKDFTNSGGVLTKEQSDKLEEVVRMSMKGNQSNRAMAKANMTLKAIDSMRGSGLRGTDIDNLNIIGSLTLQELINNKDSAKIDTEKLYSGVLKKMDKFVSRGNFDKFYETKSSLAVFDELTGIRNTGTTHSYATQLRMSAIELSKIKPTEVIEKMNKYNDNKLTVEGLEKIKKIATVSSANIDLFIDNMIESAISSKHGLTLGGLEGSKIFINTLLGNSASEINDKVINMYEKSFIKNDRDSVVNIMENLANFKKSFDERSTLLEEIVDKMESEGLNKQKLFKFLDLGESVFNKTFDNTLTKKELEKYKNYGSMYLKQVSNIESAMNKVLIKKDLVDNNEFQIYRGLALFGELLIQNDPGLEFDAKEALTALAEYRNTGMKKEDYKKLLQNKDVRNLKEQLFTSLGSATAISNVGNMRGYLSSFVERTKNDLEYDVYKNILSNKDSIKKLLRTNYFEEIFTEDLRLRKGFEKLLDQTTVGDINLLSQSYSILRKNSRDLFYKEVDEAGNNVMKVFSKYINANNTLFSNGGMSAEKSLSTLKSFRENGVPSINESSFSKAINSVHNHENKFLDDFSKIYEMLDPKFKSSGFKNLQTNKNFSDDDFFHMPLKQLNDKIDTVLFNDNMENKLLKVADPKKHRKLVISNKLSDKELNLKSNGKIYHMYTKDVSAEKLRKLFKNSDNKYYIDDMNMFYRKGKFNKRLFKSVMKMVDKYDNLFLSEELAKKRFYNNSEIKNYFLNEESRSVLSQTLLDAYRLLGEEVNEANVIKRMSFEFDPSLAAKISIERYKDMIGLPKVKDEEKYQKLLYNNLKKIINDFKKVDTDMYNDYINPNYFRVASSYAGMNLEYKTLNLDNPETLKKFERSRNVLKRLLKGNSKWFSDNDVNPELFYKMSSMEMLSKNEINKDTVRKAINDTAKIITGKQFNDINAREYNAIADSVINTLSNNKKLAGISALLSGGLFGIKVFRERTGGVYTLNKNPKGLTESDIADKLNIVNGMKTNMVTEELKKEITRNTYISINKKYF